MMVMAAPLGFFNVSSGYVFGTSYSSYPKVAALWVWANADCADNIAATPHNLTYFGFIRVSF